MGNFCFGQLSNLFAYKIHHFIYLNYHLKLILIIRLESDAQKAAPQNIKHRIAQIGFFCTICTNHVTVLITIQADFCDCFTRRRIGGFFFVVSGREFKTTTM